MEHSVAVYKSYKQFCRFKLPQVDSPSICFVVQYGPPTSSGIDICQDCHGVLCVHLTVIRNLYKGVCCSFEFIGPAFVICWKQEACDVLNI